MQEYAHMHYSASCHITEDGTARTHTKKVGGLVEADRLIQYTREDKLFRQNTISLH